jgi:type I restriction enzyme S subunit
LRGQSGQPLVTQEPIHSLKATLPPLHEQRKIAEILRTWDNAIEKLQALGAAKARRLHSLREKLTYIDARGAPKRLGDVTEEITTRNVDGRLGRDMVMGVTNSRGIVPMREQTISEDISRYKIVPHQAFAYNPMRINVGSIAMNETADSILVSPDYVVFACLQNQFLPDFLDHLRKTKWWAHYINSGGSGSVRQRTYYADLAAMKVPLPDFDRQQRITDVLNTAQRDVKATTREIDALQNQKRGLMQKLLTGEWRAPP